MAAPEIQRRRGIASRLLAAFQTVKGTAVDDFTTAATATLWTEEPQVDVGRIKSRPGPFMTQLEAEDTTGRISMPEQPNGTMRILATPKSVEWMLRSNWGPFAAGAFTLKSQIPEFLTLAWVEDYRAGATQNLIRIRDAWFHTVTFETGRDGRLVIVGEYAARAPGRLDPGVTVDALDALPGPVVLPASPMTPDDLGKFPNIIGEWRRDPTSSDVQIRISSLELSFNQNLRAEWVETSGFEVSKLGKTQALVEFRGNVSNETWAILNNARSETKDRFRLILKTTTTPVLTLTFDLFDVDFEIERLGYLPGRQYVEFVATGKANKKGSDFVGITLI